MPDRSNIIRNRITDLTDWGTYRDVLFDEVTQARFTDAGDIIRSKFTPDHFHNADMLADLIQEATNCHENIHSALRSSNSDLDVLLTVNNARDLLDGEGSFNSTNSWIKQTGWTVSGGAVEGNILNSDPARQVYRDIDGLAVGNRYLFEFEVAAFTSGNVRPFIRGTSSGVGGNHTALGNYQDIVRPNAGPSGVGFLTNSGSGFVGAVHDLVVREIPNV